MEKVAFIYGGSFIYWNSIILTLAIVAAIAIFAALYLRKSGNTMALSITIPMAAIASLALARLIHWYCRTDAYDSLGAAMSDYSWGGYALMGVFAGCILTACGLRVLRIVKNLPEMLDCMVLSGGVGIAVGRLASLFNSSDRGTAVPESWGLPFAYPVTNTVSGVVENRLATFMLQAILVAVLVLVLYVYRTVRAKKQNPLPDGDITLLFLSVYGGGQVVLDSTRYDSLFMRSNGFISIVQILGAVSLALPIIWFSVRMVKRHGLKKHHIALWVAEAALLGVAGYMEYYVQRHGDQAAFAYSIMSAAVVAMVAVTVVIRALAMKEPKAVTVDAPKEETGEVTGEAAGTAPEEAPAEAPEEVHEEPAEEVLEESVEEIPEEPVEETPEEPAEEVSEEKSEENPKEAPAEETTE